MRRLLAALGGVLGAAAVVAIGVSGARASSSPTSGSWSAPQLIAAGADGGVLAASTHDEQGRAYAAWIEDGRVMLSTWLRGAWGAPETVASPGAGASGLSAAVSDNGRVLLAWTQAEDVWAEVVGAAAADVSRSPAESASPQAAYLSGQGFVLAWRELLSGDGGYTSRRGVAVSRLESTGWTRPVLRYTPLATADAGVASVTGVGPIATADGVLAIPFTTLDTYTARASAAALVWDGHSWSRTGSFAGGECGEAGAALPGGPPVLAFRDCTGGAGRISTSSGAVPSGTVASPDVIGPPVVATVPGRMLVAWSQAAGVEASSSDGAAWSTPGLVAAGGTVVSAAGTAGGTIVVAYTTGGGGLYATYLTP